MANLLASLPHSAADEVVTPILAHRGVRIEQIVSTGQVTPLDQPFDQDHDEWVLLLAGAAGLWVEGEDEEGEGQPLEPGDCRFIPAHRRHRVTRTAPDRPTVWLAIHFPANSLS